ncbi:MAG: histidine kinase [Bacteroidaceae bacterium]|nr:histidine kinase [Bacteroidaceae bacterium]
MRRLSRQENLIYLAVWGLLFASPLLSLYVRMASDANIRFNWTEVFIAWRQFLPFLLLFLVHNFFLAPLFVYGRRRMAYGSVVLVLVAAFTLYQCSDRPQRGPHRPPMEQTEHLGPPREFRHKPKHRPHGDGMFKPADAPPPIIGEHDVLAVVILILMFGANVGIKGYFRSRDDQKRLSELEKQNLEQQLEYLRYQINPHFFMNTLNNIHALVDIDPEQAKNTILELSKMMRFVLYEGNKQYVHLYYELDFIRHYVALMQLRYTDKVRISLDLPLVPDRKVPPLILITFIENAFKHGISYQNESFIEIAVAVEGENLQFSCRNSKADTSIEDKGGVGLANVRRRLDLLYGHNYSLKIQDEADVYSVELTLPLKS